MRRFDFATVDRIFKHPSAASPPITIHFFVASEKSGGYYIYRMNTDGSQKNGLIGTADETFLWQTSSDSQWIFYVRPPHYFRLKFDGSELHQIHQQDMWGFYGQRAKDSKWFIFEATIDGNTEIYRSRINGKSLTNLTLNQAEDRNPQISPDGEWILFSSERNGSHEIYKMKLDGSSLYRLTQNTVDDLGAIWSPNGNWILYVSFFEDTNVIYTMQNDGKSKKELIRLPQHLDTPRWSNDGEWIIYSTGTFHGGHELYKLKSDGSQLTRLTSNDTDERFPQWSSDNQWIVFTRENSIYKMRSDGSEVTYLADGYNALWSPIINMAWRGERLLLMGLALLALVGVSYGFRKFKDSV